ncbi:MAG: hypothetical protein LBB30_00735 [Candidatus Methanoplasma sp.]|nr:hypothetical protein [Candidatus Methanoplasma sp.]
MYTNNIGLILGFHGCSRELADRVIMGTDDFRPSRKSYDWLGNGIYFWDRDPVRAYEFAVQKKSKEPSVVGAVIDPKRCFDIRCRNSQEMLRTAYRRYCDDMGCPKERNSSYEEGIPLRRNLDCVIIEAACKMYSKNRRTFDSVIGTFFEGKEVYPRAGMRDRTHTQVCVRNLDCILGYFRPKGEKDHLQ